MKAAMPTRALWFAHVLPLYAIRFRLDRQEMLDMLHTMDVRSMNADGMMGNLSQLTSEASQSLFLFGGGSSFSSGAPYIDSLGVPEMASIKTMYACRFGISLAAAYSQVMSESRLCAQEAAAAGKSRCVLYS